MVGIKVVLKAYPATRSLMIYGYPCPRVTVACEEQVTMEAFAYALSDAFCRLLFAETNGSEPILIVDRAASNDPQRIFLVHYTISGAGSGESSRPIFKDELTGYEYGSRTTYPTQRISLEALQATIEPLMYGSPKVQLVKAIAENVLTKEKRPIKAIVSETLVERLVGLYRFAW